MPFLSPFWNPKSTMVSRSLGLTPWLWAHFKEMTNQPPETQRCAKMTVLGGTKPLVAPKPAPKLTPKPAKPPNWFVDFVLALSRELLCQPPALNPRFVPLTMDSTASKPPKTRDVGASLWASTFGHTGIASWRVTRTTRDQRLIQVAFTT